MITATLRIFLMDLRARLSFLGLVRWALEESEKSRVLLNEVSKSRGRKGILQDCLLAEGPCPSKVVILRLGVMTPWGGHISDILQSGILYYDS